MGSEMCIRDRGNAAPEAKAAARLVTDTNQEDGVARTLLRLLEEGA